MINYSTCMRGNPTDKDAAKKAYANAQYSQVMTLDKFCYHIASHGCVYSRADIQAILILAVDCLREQLLNGQHASFLNTAATLMHFPSRNISASAVTPLLKRLCST